MPILLTGFTGHTSNIASLKSNLNKVVLMWFKVWSKVVHRNTNLEFMIILRCYVWKNTHQHAVRHQ